MTYTKSDQNTSDIVCHSLKVVGGNIDSEEFMEVRTKIAQTKATAETATGEINKVRTSADAAQSTADTAIVKAHDAQVTADNAQAAATKALIKLILSTISISRARTGQLSPSSITASATLNNEAVNVRFTFDTSTDGSTWDNVYTSTADESSHTYSGIPSSVVKSGVSYYLSYIRVRIFAAGGTTEQYGESFCAISPDATNTPIWWGCLASAPADNVQIKDFYFDTTTTKLLYWTGSTWADYTSAVTGYNDAMGKALNAITQWASDNSHPIAASKAFIEAIVADNAFIDKLATRIIRSTNICTDGTTPRMTLDLNNAVLSGKSSDKLQQANLLQNLLSFKTYQNATMAKYRGVELQSDQLRWLFNGQQVGNISMKNFDDSRLYLDGSLRPQISSNRYSPAGSVSLAYAGVYGISCYSYSGYVYLFYISDSSGYAYLRGFRRKIDYSFGPTSGWEAITMPANNNLGPTTEMIGCIKCIGLSNENGFWVITVRAKGQQLGDIVGFKRTAAGTWEEKVLASDSNCGQFAEIFTPIWDEESARMNEQGVALIYVNTSGKLKTIEYCDKGQGPVFSYSMDGNSGIPDSLSSIGVDVSDMGSNGYEQIYYIKSGVIYQLSASGWDDGYSEYDVSWSVVSTGKTASFIYTNDNLLSYGTSTSMNVLNEIHSGSLNGQIVARVYGTPEVCWFNLSSGEAVICQNAGSIFDIQQTIRIYVKGNYGTAGAGINSVSGDASSAAYRIELGGDHGIQFVLFNGSLTSGTNYSFPLVFSDTPAAIGASRGSGVVAVFSNLTMTKFAISSATKGDYSILFWGPY